MPEASDNKTNHFKDTKNIVIALLAVVILVLGYFVLRGNAPEEPGKKDAKTAGGVSVADVKYDDRTMNTVDFVFSKPVGKDVEGEILGRDPAVISPAVSGVWKWTAPNVLRFEAAGGFRMATDYKISLIADRILPPGESFSGKTEFEIRTADFQIEQSTVDEEPVPDKKNAVTLKGTIRFNYGVEPEVLARKISLVEVSKDGEDKKPVDVKLLTSYWSTSMEWQSAPIEKLAEEREVELVILGDLMPADGNVPLGEDYVEEISIGSRDRLSVRDVLPEAALPESSVRIKLSSPVSPDVASDFISVEPNVKYRITRVQSSLILKGGFKPGSSYKLDIRKGLPALDDASLKEPFEKEVRFSDLAESVSFESPGMFLDSRGAQAVNLNTVNVKSVNLTIDRVYLNNLFFLFQSYGYSVWRDEYYQGSIGDYFGNRIYEKDGMKLGYELNKKVTTELDLAQYIPENETGLYQVGVVPEGQYQGVQKWILMTDIGIVAKKGRNDLLVWASSFRDLKPIPGASVKLISAQNQTIAEGKTDSKGVFRFEGGAELFKTREPLMITVEKGEDFSFLLLDNMVIDTTGLDVSGAQPSEKGYSAYVYGERDIYRPGETAEGVLIVRDASLAVPEPMPVVLKHKDSRGRVVRTLTEKLNDEGLAQYKFDIPEFAPTGNHTVEVLAGESVIGRYGFQVEEFIPDRIKVRIDPASENIEQGRKIDYGVTGLYLFGPPASNLSVETRIDLVEKPFLPDEYRGYVFTNTERKFDSREIYVQSGTLDKDGKVSFSSDVPGNLRPPSSLQAQITARVQEPGGRGVTARRDVNVDPYPYYLGIRRKDADNYAEPGKEQLLEYVAVARNNDGVREVSSGPLRAEFYRDEWNTALRRTSSGNFKYESKRDSVLLESKTIDSGGAAGELSFTPPEFGSYRVVLTDPAGGASTQISFYASGWGYSPWALKNPAEIEMEIEKDEYAPGDTAAVQVKAPFSGKLLITVERDGVYYYDTYDLDGNTASISVPVSERYRPNAYVTATLVRPVTALEEGSVARAFGAVPINVDRTNNELDVEITSPEEIRPLTPLDIVVGTAPGAYVTVAAVDEGILQLIDQKTADPFTYFYRKLALMVSTYDTFSLLLPDLSVGKSDPGGGYAARRDMQFLSTQGIRRVKPVAFWSGLIKTDDEGAASVSFDMPQFQGAVRIMAVAVKGKKFGSSERFTKVKSPLVLLPTVPRFVSLNESVVIPVSVRNDTASGGEMTVNMTVSGPATVSAMGEEASGAGEAAIKTDVPKNEEKTVYFVLDSSGDTGALKLTVTASGNGESTASETDLPVEAGLPARRTENVGRITSADTSLTVKNPDSYRDGTLTRGLNISRVPLIQFSGKLEYLLRYPYGCLEQVTSSVFPLLYISEIAKETSPETFEKSDPASLVQAGIGRISGMQAPGGGFTLWPGGGSVEPWASIYAAHFLVESRKAGYFVEESVYSGAIRFLKNEARTREQYSTGELQRAVYALYVLARDGQPETSAMDVIRTRHLQELTVESRALLGGAYAAAGDASAIEELLKGLQDVEEVARQTGGNFNSTIRNRAILLLAILEVNPGDERVPALVDRLSRDAETGFWTTQESSFALLAIGQFIKKQLESPPYSGAVLVDGREAGTFTSESVFNLPAITGPEPVEIKMEPGYSEGSAFFSLLTTGMPTPEGFTPVSEGLEVEREYLTRDGAPVNRDEIMQGDLIVLKTKIKSTAGKLQNVVIQNLLPSGFEVENPRLKTTETLKWMTGKTLKPQYLDIRDDRILLFTNLDDAKWHNYYVLLRAVNPGTFAVPPVQAEAMYSPGIRFAGQLEPPLIVKIRE